MNTSLNQGSARIYQFPAGGRSGVSARCQGETPASAEIASPRVSPVAVGGAWFRPFFQIGSHAIVGRLACLSVLSQV